MMQQKYLKRTAEDLEPAGAGSGDGGFGEPPVKLQCTQGQHQHQQGPGGGGGGGPHHGHGQHQPGNGANSTGPTPGGGGGTGGGDGNEGLTKFQVQIVQQLEFTTSAANNSQAQAISTNVTVKALTNASVKSDLLNASSSPKPGPDTSASAASRDDKPNFIVCLENIVTMRDNLEDVILNSVDITRHVQMPPSEKPEALHMEDLLGSTANRNSECLTANDDSNDIIEPLTQSVP